MLDQVRQDLVYAFRRLRLSPGFTLGAVAVLALGVGVNLAEFHIFNAVLFPKIFVRDIDSLRRLSIQSKTERPGGFSYPESVFFREHNTVLSAVLTETFGGALTLDGDSANVAALYVSGNYFSDLGAVPAYGRLLDESDTKPDAAPVVVLAYSYWQRQFGADPGVVGRIIHLNSKPIQVVGIASYDFSGLRVSDWRLWAPVTVHPYLNQDSNLNDFNRGNTAIYARVKPGISSAAAEQQLTSLHAEIQKRAPRSLKPGEWIQSHLLNEIPISAREAGQALPFILLILLILFSACANLGNMLLARGLLREREIGIRIAVGAGRWRVIRQLMTENLLLALLGTAAGLLVGQLTAQLLLRILTAPPSIRIVTDWRILLTGVVLTFLSTLIFGLTPAIQTVRGGPKVTRARQTLVAVQVAASCVLLIVGSLLTRSIVRTLTADLRMDYKHLLVVDAQLYQRDLAPPAARQILGEFSARLQNLPGVDGVAMTTAPPVGGGPRMVHTAGAPPLSVNDVDASYFSVVRVPIVRGRTFRPGEQDVVVVSESAARAMWPNADALGKILDFSKRKWTVVGVARDSGSNLLGDSDSVEVYKPMEDQFLRIAMLIVHTAGDPAVLIAPVRAAMASPGVASSAWLVEARMKQRSDNVRRAMSIIGSLGVVATALAAIGIFGLVSFAVSHRTREIGVRMALGARGSHILQAVLSQYAMPVGVGVASGVALALAFCKILKNQIRSGVDFFDPTSYTAGVALFAAIAFAAALIPAARALRIDPSAALRAE